MGAIVKKKQLNLIEFFFIVVFQWDDLHVTAVRFPA
jgi:hypothetical protein